MNVSLFDEYPRSMGHPVRDAIVYTKQQRDEYIKRYIKISDIYMSVYKYTEIKEDGEHVVTDSAVVNKIFFDFDTKDWLNDVFTLHEWCWKYNLLHRCHCSGRGGHVFIFIKPNLQHKKKALANAQRGICDKLDLTIDNRIVGDIGRIFRYLNTYNWKAKRYCIPIIREDFINPNFSEEYIFELAKKQRFVNAWMGSKLLDISKYDINHYQNTHYEIEIDFKEINENIEIEDFDKFPPCVQSWLSTPIVADYVKHLETLYLKDQLFGYKSPSEIVSILKKSWHPSEFDHYFGTGKGVLPRRHYGHRGMKWRKTMKNDYFMPSCNILKEKGLCTSKTCTYANPIYDFN
jgi:hypothetical protein